MPGSRLPWTPLLIIATMTSVVVYSNIVSPSLGQENRVSQKYRPQRPPVALAGPIDHLRAAWNSEGEADWPAAEVLASVSKLSYLRPIEAERSYRALGFQRTRPFHYKSLGGYVVSEDDVAVVAFQGTDDLSEWIVNLDSFSYYTPHGDMHEGYHRAYQHLKPQVLKLLEESKARKIWITGHSLGGALALICAYDLITHEKIQPHGLMTFGQPMVADKFLAHHMDNLLLGRYVHFVNEQDIVPRLPPGFAHSGSLVWFTGGEIRRSLPKRTVSREESDHAPTNRHDLIKPLSKQEFKDLQAELQASDADTDSPFKNAAFKKKQAPVWIQDHAIGLYLKRIQTVNERTEGR